MTTTAIATEVGVLLVPTTTATDYADAYRAARVAVHTAATFTEGDKAAARADHIDRLATRAGITLDLITLDTEAREA